MRSTGSPIHSALRLLVRSASESHGEGIIGQRSEVLILAGRGTNTECEAPRFVGAGGGRLQGSGDGSPGHTGTSSSVRLKEGSFLAKPCSAVFNEMLCDLRLDGEGQLIVVAVGRQGAGERSRWSSASTVLDDARVSIELSEEGTLSRTRGSLFGGTREEIPGPMRRSGGRLGAEDGRIRWRLDHRGSMTAIIDGFGVLHVGLVAASLEAISESIGRA